MKLKGKLLSFVLAFCTFLAYVPGLSLPAYADDDPVKVTVNIAAVGHARVSGSTNGSLEAGEFIFTDGNENGSIDLTAEEDWYFPSDWGGTVNGAVSVTEKSVGVWNIEFSPLSTGVEATSDLTEKEAQGAPGDEDASGFAATGYESGRFATLSDTIEVTLDGESSYKAVAQGDTFTGITPEHGVRVRFKATDTKKAGTLRAIELTRAEAPEGTSVTVVDCTSGLDNGKLKGVTSDMEYRNSAGVSSVDAGWTAGNGSDIEGLAAGTYQIRTKASGTELASEYIEKLIAGSVAPTGYSVTITVPSNVATSGGDTSQSNLTAAMDPITVNANGGYYFPENYTSGITGNGADGVTVERVSPTQLTISGTPTDTVSLTLPDPTEAATSFNVTINLGTGMKLASDSTGNLSQTGVTGAIDTITVEAEDDYYFPDNYISSITKNGEKGIIVARTNKRKITISGTPTGYEVAVAMTLPAATAKTREDKPTSVTFTGIGADSGELKNTAADMKYSIDGGSSWTDCTAGNTTIASGVTATSGIKVVKKASDTDTKKDSDPLTITVTKPDAPTGYAKVDSWSDENTGEIGALDSIKRYQLSNDDGETWIGMAASITEIQGLAPGTYLLRYEAGDGKLASDAATITIGTRSPSKEPLPSMTFKATGEDSGEINGTTTRVKYSLDGGNTWKDCTDTKTVIESGIDPSKGIKVYVVARSVRYLDSDAVGLTIQSQTAPSIVGKTDCKVGGDGVLTGMTSDMEYKLADASAWIQAIPDADNEVTGLEAGTYKVRYAAHDNYLASPATSLEILAPDAIATPVLTAETKFKGTMEISMSCSTDGVDILYTLDGSDVSKDSDKYTAPITIDKTTTVKVVAMKTKWSYRSSQAEATYTKLAEYKITFKAGEGAKGDMAAATAYEDEPYKLPACSFTKDGYEFKAWTIAGADGEFKPGDVFTFTGDAELTATYTEKKKSGGGSGSSSSSKTAETNAKTEAAPVEGTKTETRADGTKVVTVTAKDGSITTTVTTPSGVTQTVEKDKKGKETAISVSIPESTVKKIAESKKVIKVPVTVKTASGSASAAVIKVDVPEGISKNSPANLEIPVENGTNTTVAAIVNADGTEQIIPTAKVDQGVIDVAVTGDAKLKIFDNKQSYKDVSEGRWSIDSINFVTSRKIFNGVGNGNYDPAGYMNRGMLIKAMCNMEGGEEGTNTFADGAGKWWAGAAAWGAAKNIMSGIGGNSFGGDQLINREQLGTSFYRLAVADGKVTEAESQESVSKADLSQFSDGDSVSEYAQKAIAWCVKRGLLKGMDGMFDPKGLATREQVSAITERYCNLD